MFRCLVVLLCAACAACSTTSYELKRGTTYALPGGAVVATYEQERTTRTSDFPIHKDGRVEPQVFTTTVRTYPIVIDPVSKRAHRVASVAGEMTPYYWDRDRKILWVSDPKDGSVLGISTAGAHFPGDPVAKFIRAPDLGVPIATWERRSRRRIWNAATSSEFKFESDQPATRHADGALLRFATVQELGDRVTVREVVIDWSGSSPMRLPDLLWQSPASGARLAFAVTPDGRRFVEVVQDEHGRRVASHDMTSAAGAVVTSSLEEGEAPSLAALAGNLVAVRQPDVDGCWRGAIFDASTGTLSPLTGTPCVTGHAQRRGLAHALFDLADKHVGFYDVARRQVVDLGVLAATSVVDPATIVFARPVDAEYEIVRFDLRAGSSTSVARWPRPPAVLQATRDAIVIGEGHDIYVGRGTASSFTRIPVPEGVASTPVDLDRSYETAGLGQPPDRFSWLFGFDFGGSTTGTVAGAFRTAIRDTLSPRWAVAVGFAMYSQGSDPDKDYTGAYGTLIVSRYLRPRFRGWYASGEAWLGGAKDDDDDMPRWTFAPGAALGFGYQGRLFEGSITTAMPTVIDPERGVSIMLGLKLAALGGTP